MSLADLGVEEPAERLYRRLLADPDHPIGDADGPLVSHLMKSGIMSGIDMGLYGTQVSGVGTDPSRGVAIVYASAVGSEQVRTDLKELYGNAVVFRTRQVHTAAEADRSRDDSPHFGGAGYRQWTADHSQYWSVCSTAFPVIVSGTRYMLTAGHCLPGGTSYKNLWASTWTDWAPLPASDYYFGTRGTTTMGGEHRAITAGTVGRYGDWALIRGSNYNPYVYNCANTSGSCSSLPIGGASFQTPAVGTPVCTSGVTTAQICRQYVVDSDCYCQVNYDGDAYYVNHYTIIRHKNSSGTWDCVTIKGGDSGGAVYQGMSSKPGYVRAMGVITAAGGCQSGYTRLSGLGAFSGTALVVTAG